MGIQFLLAISMHGFKVNLKHPLEDDYNEIPKKVGTICIASKKGKMQWLADNLNPTSNLNKTS